MQQKPTKNKTILVVEDDIDTNYVVGLLLAAEGYTIVAARDGVAGWTAYETAKPDIVVTDLFMPRLNGIDLVIRIRQTDSSTPVIAITGYSDAAIERAYYHGFDAVTRKPLVFADFIETIDQLLRLTPDELRANRSAHSTARSSRTSDGLRSHRSKPSSAAQIDRGIDGTSRQNFVSVLVHKGIERVRRWKNSKSLRSDEESRAIWGAVAHGLKGEFSHIASSINEIRESGGTSEEVQIECEIIQRSVEYSQLLLRRLENYLDLSRPRRESSLVFELIARAEALARPRLPSTVQFQVEIAADAGDRAVSCDIEQMMGVLIELVNNASTAIRESGGSIWMKAEKRDSEIAISVKNSGPEIPDDLRGQLFRTQVASKTGSGWGLYLSSRVVSAMGGKLELTNSSSSGGTTFTVRLQIIGN